MWQLESETGEVLYNAHLIHLVRNEFAGSRMRSRFWLGDVEAVEDPNQRAAMAPPSAAVVAWYNILAKGGAGLFLASKLPALYQQHTPKPTSKV
jgi:hypothetical protein